MSLVTSVPAFRLKVLSGRRMAPMRSARWARYLRTAEFSLSRVPLLVMNATIPPGRTLSQRFAKEIVVDQPVVLVVPLIQHLEIPKGDVAHGHIKKAGPGICTVSKAVYGNAGVLVKLPRNPPGNGIQLHAIGFAARHICGEQAKENCRCRRMAPKCCPLGKAHLGQGLIDSPDDHRRRVKGR